MLFGVHGCVKENWLKRQHSGAFGCFSSQCWRLYCKNTESFCRHGIRTHPADGSAQQAALELPAVSRTVSCLLNRREKESEHQMFVSHRRSAQLLWRKPKKSDSRRFSVPISLFGLNICFGLKWCSRKPNENSELVCTQQVSSCNVNLLISY